MPLFLSLWFSSARCLTEVTMKRDSKNSFSSVALLQEYPIRRTFRSYQKLFILWAAPRCAALTAVIISIVNWKWILYRPLLINEIQVFTDKHHSVRCALYRRQKRRLSSVPSATKYKISGYYFCELHRRTSSSKFKKENYLSYLRVFTLLLFVPKISEWIFVFTRVMVGFGRIRIVWNGFRW